MQNSNNSQKRQYYSLTHNRSRTRLQLSLEITFLKLKDYPGSYARVVFEFAACNERAWEVFGIG